MSPTLESVTQRIYRLVVAGMTVIALLAIVRSFAGGNELAGQRLAWGPLAFTYPGMWDLLGVIGSVLWVGTRKGLTVRRWGVGLTIVAVLVVGVSLASEAYLTARDVLGGAHGGAGLPEAAAVMGFLVPVVYCVLTHVAAQCRVALIAPEEEPSTPTTPTPRSSRSEGPRPAAPVVSPTRSSSDEPSTSGTSSALELAPPPARGYGLPTDAPTTSPSSTSSPRTPSTAETTPPTSSSSPTSSSTPSAPEPDDADTDELETQPSTPPAQPFDSVSSAPPSQPSGPPTAPPVAPAPGLDRDDPNRFPTPDGQATREARRRWVLEELRAGRDPSGADVETRFGPPRSGAAIVREARSRFAELEGALR